WSAVEAELASAAGTLTEGGVVRTTVAGTPRGALLAVGNSLPVREVDWYVPGWVVDVRVFAQRGASGIDGWVAGAAGAAQAAQRPVVVLLGDVSLAHDVGGLAAAQGLQTPLVLMVVDNGGGRIFDQLPIADEPQLRDTLERHFIMAPGIDFAHAAAAFG